jgi:hypothetical protein
VACNRLNKIFIVNSSSKSCANLLIPELLLLHFRCSFRAIFVLDLIRRFWVIWLRISLRGSWVDALRTFVDDLDPSNVGNRARFGEFWMNSSLCFKRTRFVILVDWIGLGLQDFGHSFSYRRFSSTQNLGSIHTVVWDIRRLQVGGYFSGSQLC